ncbi:MAG TPA: 2-C-methyl-D-erythritol 4-phosphate cytidylyltransferase [Frankiaceae bacterium]|nr:2-C-methyl-D-erythritol 4-phosphate cytidylyltransferase [Frankiaceae bacterium]
MPAAGSGVRLGPGDPKALRLLAGRSLLFHAVSRLRAAGSVGSVVVAVPAGCEREIAEELSVVTVTGGATRQESVRAALEVLPPDVDVVLVHDAARPLAPVSLIEAVAAAVIGGAPAVVPGIPVDDTVKRVGADGIVHETPPRETLRAIQTPQGFRRSVLERAHALAGTSITDDAGLVELLGEAVLVIPGAAEAFKITRPDDLARAEALLAAQTGAPA